MPMQGIRVWSLGWKDSLEKVIATQYSILAWRTPRTEEPGWLQSMGQKSTGHNWATNTFTFHIQESLSSTPKQIQHCRSTLLQLKKLILAVNQWVLYSQSELNISIESEKYNIDLKNFFNTKRKKHIFIIFAFSLLYYF